LRRHLRRYLDTDEQHCGDCDTTCVGNKICGKGKCTCPTELTECSDACADLATDEAHCGACETKCAAGEICINSRCGCPTGQTLCGDRCADLNSDPMFCGSCSHACPAGQFCTDGACLISPCDGLCTQPESIMANADGYRVEPLGSAARCFEVKSYRPTATEARLVCWEFAGGRTLKVNGVTAPCAPDEGFPLTKERAGGYCIQIGPGGADYAGILLPTK
jgi:hypothetical protein